MRIVGSDHRVGVEECDDGRVQVALNSAAENRGCPPIGWGPAADADTARGSGAGARDLSRVHDNVRYAGLGIAEDDEPVQVWETARFVGAIAGDPLERDNIFVS